MSFLYFQKILKIPKEKKKVRRLNGIRSEKKKTLKREESPGAR